MKCPYCNKEIKDDAVFCGFCGKQIPQIPLVETSQSPPPDKPKSVGSDETNNIPSDEIIEGQSKKTKHKPQKKRTGFKVLLIFLLFSAISGSVLGFLTARDFIPIKSLFTSNGFKWTSLSEGQFESTTSDDSEYGGNEKEGASSASPTDEETETTLSMESTDSSSEPTAPEESQQPTESNSHYAKYIGDSLVVIDDKAHIWTEASVSDIMANAKAMSEASGYSIMIVVTNDMFGMTSQEFADEYYDHVLTSNRDQTELISDGYIFLINLADHEYYLSTSGNAIDVYTDAVMDELFSEIQQFMVDGDYEAAVNKVIEKQFIKPGRMEQ